MAMYDVLIRGGTVVDGTGVTPRVADVAVKNGRIVELGRPEGPAAEVINADGLVVSPGFIDVHTHYDAQAMWDPTFSPSPLHGITTVIGGNCGFSIAPLFDQADYLMRMLARVEGMPVTALATAVPWSWTSFADWLTMLSGNVAINCGFLVGHSALRCAVMGADAVGRAAAEHEIAAMEQLLLASLHEGGLGFSTTRSQTHLDHNGELVPSHWATNEEILRLAAVAGRVDGTSIEVLPTADSIFSEAVIDLMVRLATGSGRPVNWNLLTVLEGEDPRIQRSRLAASDQARSQDATVVALTMPDAPRGRKTLRSGVTFDLLPGWAEVMRLPLQEKIAALQDPNTRCRLAEGAKRVDPNTAAAKINLGDWAGTRISDVANPTLLPCVGRTVGLIAKERRADPFDVMLDIAIADDLATGFESPRGGDDDASWKRRAQMWRDPRVVIGGSDAGAHVDEIATYRSYTNFVGPVVRDRQLITIEDAIHLLSQVPAELLNLRDRGILRRGYRADIVIFDAETVGAGPIRQVHDLPGGAMRLFSEAEGVEHVIVNGVEIARSGSYTGACPGMVLTPT